MNKEAIKKMAIIGAGITLSSSIMYHIFVKSFGVKPFNENLYSKSKVTMEDNGKNGVTYKYIYTDEQLLNNSVIIRTPYYFNDNGNIVRKVYSVDVNMFSNEQLDYIMKNVTDQESLLNKDYINNIITIVSDKNTNDDIGLNFICSESSMFNEIPLENNYEISFATYTRDDNDLWYYKSYNLDVSYSILYLIFTVLMSGGVCGLGDVLYTNFKRKKIDREHYNELCKVAKLIDSNADETKLFYIIDILSRLETDSINVKNNPNEIINKYYSFMYEISSKYPKCYLNNDKKLVLEKKNKCY